MKTYNVTLVMILGYYDSEYQQPRLRMDEYTVQAESENEAITKAKSQDKTGFSIWESYATEDIDSRINREETEEGWVK